MPREHYEDEDMRNLYLDSRQIPSFQYGHSSSHVQGRGAYSVHDKAISIEGGVHNHFNITLNLGELDKDAVKVAVTAALQGLAAISTGEGGSLCLKLK